MIFHNFKYALKEILRRRTSLIWTLLFPIALGTFMYMAFGEILEKEERLDTISVAVVDNGDSSVLTQILEQINMDDDENLFDVHEVSEEDAYDLLEDEKISGIIFTKDTSLIVKQSGYNELVIQSVLRQYKQKSSIIEDIVKVNPAGVAQAVEVMNEGGSYVKESKTTEGSQNAYNNYFYAIFAMSCLFSSFAGGESARRLHANESALGMRRCLGPVSKFVQVVAQYLSLLLVQFAMQVITFIYLNILGVDFPDKYPQIFGILLLGCSIGISMGIIIGSFAGLSEGAMTGIAVSVSMALSVMADLCAAGVKDLIEHKLPIINRINPAAIISDSFYSLSVYDDYSRYAANMAILAGMSIVLLLISCFMLKRGRYASL